MTPDFETHFSNRDLTRLRKGAGQQLRALRENAGLSQRDLAARLNMTFYTYVSTIENGRSTVSVQQFHAWARALEVDVRDLVLMLMPYYDPITYRVLYGEEAWEGAVGEYAYPPEESVAMAPAV